MYPIYVICQFVSKGALPIKAHCIQLVHYHIFVMRSTADVID